MKFHWNEKILFIQRQQTVNIVRRQKKKIHTRSQICAYAHTRTFAKCEMNNQNLVNMQIFPSAYRWLQSLFVAYVCVCVAIQFEIEFCFYQKRRHRLCTTYKNHKIQHAKEHTWVLSPLLSLSLLFHPIILFTSNMFLRYVRKIGTHKLSSAHSIRWVNKSNQQQAWKECLTQ